MRFLQTSLALSMTALAMVQAGVLRRQDDPTLADDGDLGALDTVTNGTLYKCLDLLSEQAFKARANDESIRPTLVNVAYPLAKVQFSIDFGNDTGCYERTKKSIRMLGFPVINPYNNTDDVIGWDAGFTVNSTYAFWNNGTWNTCNRGDVPLFGFGASNASCQAPSN
ncbi:MAG: hypothetical protein M1838_002062 [Thelocarpon superellum]|nr:MAG: hypothetical protein M1838_002062 [Thelocarpon superellum]